MGCIFFLNECTEPRKKTLTFHCTGCLIGIPIVVQVYTPHVTV